MAAYMAPRYGLKGVWTAMAIELTFRGILFITRLLYGGWQNTLHKNNETSKT